MLQFTAASKVIELNSLEERVYSIDNGGVEFKLKSNLQYIFLLGEHSSNYIFHLKIDSEDKLGEYIFPAGFSFMVNGASLTIKGKKDIRIVTIESGVCPNVAYSYYSSKDMKIKIQSNYSTNQICLYPQVHFNDGATDLKLQGSSSELFTIAGSETRTLNKLEVGSTHTVSNDQSFVMIATEFENNVKFDISTSHHASDNFAGNNCFLQQMEFFNRKYISVIQTMRNVNIEFTCNSDNDNSSSNNSKGYIAGITIVTIIAIVAIAGLVFVIIRSRKASAAVPAVPLL